VAFRSICPKFFVKMSETNTQSTLKLRKHSKCHQISRAIFQFFHNTKEAEQCPTKPMINTVEIARESSDENTAEKKDSASSQEPLMDQEDSSSTSLDETRKNDENQKQEC
jgi:hypothetical protein